MRRGIIILSFFCVVAIAQPVFAAKATAVIKGTAEASTISGEATFMEANGGLDVEVTVSGATPGKHGFHIHENGACGDAGKAAGGHYNPDTMMHGLVMKDGFEHAHAGDFGNIEVGANGVGALQFSIPGLALTGEKHNVAGKAVILHEKEDDFGQPTGNAGGRIGCGIITVVEEKANDAMVKPDSLNVGSTTTVPNEPAKEISK